MKLDHSALSIVAFSPDAKDMAENLYRALWSWVVCVLVTIIVSYCGQARPESELNGLVYGATVLPNEGPVPLIKNHWFWAAIVIVVFFVFNLVFF